MMLTTDSSLWVPFTISNPVDIASLPYPTLTLANYFDYNSGDIVKGVKNREAYYFAVRAVYASEVASGLRSTGKQTYTTAPKITKIVNSGGYTTATYDKVTGVAKYRLFAWDGKKRIAKGAAYGNAIKFKNNADARKNRILMVRAMNSKGALISSYWESSLASNGKITYYLPGALTSKNTF